MKPIEATLRGFRSFRDDRPACVSFEGISAVAIIGDTGAGKSSILEAMTWALYGETSKGARVIQHVMHDHADRLEASLVFEVNTKTYHVRRNARRTRAGQVEGDGAVLSEVDADRRPTTIVAEQVGPVTRAIERIVGLDADAFQRTTILPQGRFSRLLAEDDQKVRAAVLRQIWSTDEIDHAQVRVATASKRAAELLALAGHERANHPEDPAAHTAGLAAATEKAETNLKTADRQRDAASRAVKAEENNQRTAAATDDATRRIQAAADDWRYARQQAEGVENARLTLVRATETTIDVRNHLHDDVQNDQAARGSVETRIRGAGTLRNLARTSDRAAEATDKAAAADEEAAEAHRTANAVRDAGPQLRDTLKRTTTAAVEAEQNARAGLSQSIEAAATADHAARTLANLRERLLDERPGLRAQNAAAASRRAAEAAREATDSLKNAEAAEEAAASLATEARRLSAATAAAHGHKPGDPCPVCDQRLPTAWRAPSGGDLAAAVSAESQAKANAAWARTTAAEAHREAAAAAGNADAAADRAATAEERIAEDALKAGDAAGADTAGWPAAADKRVDLLARAASFATAGAKGLAQRARGLRMVADRFTKERSAAEQAASANTARLEAAYSTAASAERRADAASAENKRATAAWTTATATASTAAGASPGAENTNVRGTGRDLSLHIRRLSQPGPVTPEAAAAGLAAADEMDQSAAATAKLVERAALAEEHARRAAADLEQFEKTSGKPLSDIRRKINARIQEIERSICGEETRAADGFDADPCDEANAAAAALAERTEAAHTAARTVLSEAQYLICGYDYGSNADDVLDRATRKRDSAAGTLSHAEAETRAFAARRPAIEDLERLRVEIEVLAGQLDETKRALGPGAFPKYVTLRRSARLLAHAGAHLKTMTAGRYRFRDPRDTEERWRVYDAHNGRDRDPSQLSGGEQFLASLALALGTVETIGRTGGEVRTLCIDEGFGSLDQTTLRRAIAGLRKAAGEQHLIVLVSHVREVAEAVDDVIVVERDQGGGSRVRRLDAATKGGLPRP